MSVRIVSICRHEALVSDSEDVRESLHLVILIDEDTSTTPQGFGLNTLHGVCHNTTHPDDRTGLHLGAITEAERLTIVV